ncbi:MULTISPECIES: hypothetical protein [unclassified Burkholderia]|uniref:hypothetical protein n=1 Tax=unclassified Burkholderia TaxID=2613784 RepID=UPI002AB137F6|nr:MULTISPECIES: hypothetical protein [unclassified Burkholderia]
MNVLGRRAIPKRTHRGTYSRSRAGAAPSILAAFITVLAIVFLQWSFRATQVRNRQLAHVGWLHAAFAAMLFAI